MTDNGNEIGRAWRDGRPLPVLRWEPGFEFAEPPNYRPSFVELDDGRTIDESRLPWILAEILERHPEADRIRRDALEHPGLEVIDEPDEGMMILARLSWSREPIGSFDRRLLLA